jgi:SAM-dependent methyltransferase
MSEADEVKRRFARRSLTLSADRYSALQPEVLLWMQERERALIRLLRSQAPKPLAELGVLEIGCGSGGNLLELIRLGFDPANLVGNELLAERAASARARLPEKVRVLEGDALALPIDDGSMDIVYQSTVFTSLLDAGFRAALAQRMWNWVRPGGSVLWYDFVYDNPSNPDVRGVSMKSVRELFPAGEVTFHRVTLAPPISRRVSRIHPMAYHLLNTIPWLRTHVLCWIRKRSEG